MRRKSDFIGSVFATIFSVILLYRWFEALLKGDIIYVTTTYLLIGLLLCLGLWVYPHNGIFMMHIKKKERVKWLRGFTSYT